MRFINRIAIFLTLITILTGSPFPQTSASSASWQNKVDPWVLTTAAEGETEFLIYLSQQADLSQAAALNSKLEKGTYVYETLSALAERTQKPILAELERLGIEHRSYWVANMIWARGNMDAVQALANRPDVAHLHANPWVKVQEPSRDEEASIESPDAIEWNILKVNADDVWALGYNGQGAVIAGQDTGYDWDHPGLINQYRGWEGGVADHNYNWHDAIHSGGGVCGPNSDEPCDDHGHGTHTMGTMVGDDGGINQVGMAPGARWIGCRNMDVGWGSPATYSECYEWFIAPTDLNDENPDPSKAPHVINNSWGCPPEEGCTDPNVLLTVVQSVRAAGILTAHSAGNSGSACYTVDTPAAIYDESYTVGATDSGDNIASFSSRGTVTVDGSHRLKPDISAPGVSIRSTARGGGYTSMSGTSMAGPHVAGLVGLLISANPILAGNVDMIEEIINASALPRTSAQTCDGIPGTDIPNPIYGWGRIDALEAVSSHLYIAKSASSTWVAPGDLLTYTLELTHTNLAGLETHNVVLTDVLPADTTFVNASGPYTVTNGVVNWDFSSLAANESTEVSFVVEVSPQASGEVVNNDYAVHSAEVQLVQGQPVSTEVIPFDLALGKRAPAFTAPGTALTYTLSITNPHPFAPLSSLVLTDSLPAHASFLSATTPYTLSGGLVTWKLPSLEAGEVWTRELVVQVPMTFTGTIANQFYGARADQVDVRLGDPVQTQIHALAVDKSASAEQVYSGDLLTYTLNVTNLHPLSPTHSLVLSDLLPLNTEFIDASGAFTLTEGAVVWERSQLDPGETWSEWLVVRIPPTAYDVIRNEHYAAWSMEAPTPIAGVPVSTRAGYRYNLPVIFNSP
jgi:serine protease AprX